MQLRVTTLVLCIMWSPYELQSDDGGDSEWLTVVRPAGVDNKVAVRTAAHTIHNAFSTTAVVIHDFDSYSQNRYDTSLIFKCNTVKSRPKDHTRREINNIRHTLCQQRDHTRRQINNIRHTPCQQTAHVDKLTTSDIHLVNRQTTHVDKLTTSDIRPVNRPHT